MVLLPGGTDRLYWQAATGLDSAQFYLALRDHDRQLLQATPRHRVRRVGARIKSSVRSLAPVDRGTQGFDPEGLKYIWPGTVDQTVEQAFHGSYFLYESGGKHKKPYMISAFSNDPGFLWSGTPRRFSTCAQARSIIEGEAEFAHVRPTLHTVAERAKQIKGHYRFFCYSNGAISLKDDTAHLAPDKGPTWWASGTRPMVCSSLVLAAVDDVPTYDSPGGPWHVHDRARPGKNAPAYSARCHRTRRQRTGRRTDARRYVLSTPPTSGSRQPRPCTTKRTKRHSTHPEISADCSPTRRDDVANQICNTFAFDYSGREFDDEDAKDSEKWRDPGRRRMPSAPTTCSSFGIARSISGTRFTVCTAQPSAWSFATACSRVRDRRLGHPREDGQADGHRVTTRGRPSPGRTSRSAGKLPRRTEAAWQSSSCPRGSTPVEAGVLINGLFSRGGHPGRSRIAATQRYRSPWIRRSSTASSSSAEYHHQGRREFRLGRDSSRLVRCQCHPARTLNQAAVSVLRTQVGR